MLSDYYGLLDDSVRDRADVIQQPARDAALDAAVQRYSLDRPRESVEDVTALSSGYFLPLPLAWEAGFSQLNAVELNPGSTILQNIPGGQCAIYVMPAGQQIRLPDGLPVYVGATSRVRFTVAHTLDGSTDTIPTYARQALASYAAAILCEQLAAYYAGDSDPTIQADAVAHQTKSQTWGARSRVLRDAYFKFLGVDSAPKVLPAGGYAVFGTRKRFTRGITVRA